MSCYNYISERGKRTFMIILEKYYIINITTKEKYEKSKRYNTVFNKTKTSVC